MHSKKLRLALVLVLLATISGTAAWLIGGPIRAHRRVAVSPNGVPDFTLLDHRGVIHQLSREADAKAIAVIAHSNAGPIESARSINDLHRLNGPKGVVVWMINAEDDRAAIIKQAQASGLNVPVLMDPSQIVTKALGLTRAGETVILHGETREVLNRGALSEPALAQIVSGKPVTVSAAPADGPAISFLFQPPGKISFEKTISPILAAKCVTCHRQNSKFPPYFSNYESVRSWAAMIRETLFTDRMPPFSADTYYGKYLNDISLAPAEKRLLVQWIDEGAPRDSSQGDPLKSPHPRAQPKRSLSGMKMVYSVEMAEAVKIPPRGEVVYRYFQMGGAAPRDIWARGIWVRTTNPRQLHHESIMITPNPLAHYMKRAESFRGDDEGEDNEDGHVPTWTLMAMENEADSRYARAQVWGLGRAQPIVYRENAALFIPKGYYVILESHYMGTGKEETEKTQLQFYGAYEQGRLRPSRAVRVRSVNFEIPAGVHRHVVRTEPMKFDRDIEILSFLGHMHMRGRSVKALQRLPDGSEKVIVSIPNFYFGWQTGTGLAPDPPIKVVAGSEIRVECEYDNSAMNPNNPDPNKTVKFGQTHDRSEMCKINLQVVDSVRSGH